MSNQLPYRLELEHRRAIVSLLPELNDVPWADIERVGSDIIAKIQTLSSPNLLVDLCALNYMGSAQVALVVRMFKTIKEKNGKMVVANRDPMVLEVLSLAGLNKVWTIVDSRERAMSMLGGGGGSMTAGSGGGGGSMDSEANPLPGMVAIIAAVAAAVFAVIHAANPTLLPARGDLFGILGGSVVAFLSGLWAMSSGNKGLGIGVLVTSVALLLYGVFEIAKPQSAAPAGGAAAPDAASATPAAGAPAAATDDDAPSIIATPNPPAANPGAANPGAANPAAAQPPPAAAPGAAAAPPATPPAAPK